MDVLVCLVNKHTLPPSPQPLPPHMKNNGWPGRKCPRPLYHLNSFSKRVPMRQCTGGEHGTPCLSCQLNIVENENTFKYKDYVRRRDNSTNAFCNLKLVFNSDYYDEYTKASPLTQILLCPTTMRLHPESRICTAR
jgi:hypothetical protein